MLLLGTQETFSDVVFIVLLALFVPRNLFFFWLITSADCVSCALTAFLSVYAAPCLDAHVPECSVILTSSCNQPFSPCCMIHRDSQVPKATLHPSSFITKKYLLIACSLIKDYASMISLYLRLSFDQ